MENKDISSWKFPFTQIRDGLHKSWFKNIGNEELVEKDISLHSEWRIYNIAKDGVACCALVPNVNIYSYAKNVNIFSACGLSRVFTYGEHAHVSIGRNNAIVCASGNETSVNIGGDYNFSLIGGCFSDVSIHGNFNITSVTGTGVSVSDFGRCNSISLYGTDILSSVLGDGGELRAEGSGARISVLGPHNIIDISGERCALSILSDNCAFRIASADTVVLVAEYGCLPEESQESVIHSDIFSTDRLNIKTGTWYMYESGKLHELENPPSYRDYGYTPENKVYKETTILSDGK